MCAKGPPFARRDTAGVGQLNGAELRLHGCVEERRVCVCDFRRECRMRVDSDCFYMQDCSCGAAVALPYGVAGWLAR